MSEKENKTPIYKRWWFWVIIVIVIIGVAAAASSSSKEPQKVGEGNDGSSEQSGSSSESENKTFKVGDTIAIDSQEMTILEVKRNWSAQYSKPEEGKEYIAVKVRLVNKGSDKLSYYNTQWEVEDGDGAIEGPTIVLGNDDSLDYGDLAAGGKKEGTIIFKVPKDDTSLKFHYKSRMFGGKEAVINL